MARKTQAEKIDELEKLVATLTERLDNIRAEVGDLAEMRTKLAVVEERLTEMKRAGEESNRMRWSLVPSLVAALVGAILTLLVQLVLHSLRTGSR